MNTEELILTVMEDGDLNCASDIQSALYALEDGELLGHLGVDQETVEEAYAMLRTRLDNCK